MIYLTRFFILTALTVSTSFSALAQDTGEERQEDNTGVEQLAKSNLQDFRSSQRLSVASAGLMFASFDSDGDYEITQAERAAGIKAAFTAADRNANGTLSLVEVDAWRQRALGSLDLLPGNTQFDRNFDSSVSRAEFTEVLTRNGNRLDVDENGVLDFSELLTKSRPAQAEKQQRRRIFDSRADRQRRR